MFVLQLVAQHGAEADRHLFRCLFSHVDFSGDGKSSGKDFHQVGHREVLLHYRTDRDLSRIPNLSALDRHIMGKTHTFLFKVGNYLIVLIFLTSELF